MEVAGTELEVVTVGNGVEVVDQAIGQWLVRFEPLPEAAVIDSVNRAAAVGVAAGLVEALPRLRGLLTNPGALRVSFSPAAQRALADGAYRLMADGAYPIAVDASGRIVEIAKVAGTAGATVGVGAALSASWPVILGAGIAMAAATAQQRWLERTFAGLSSQLGRIETRLRDDDLGALDGADSLVDLMAQLGVSALPPQLLEELAVARRQVDSIYFSRRRFVERLKRDLEAQQTQHEAKTGERKAWAGDIAKQLRDDTGAVDELIVFLRAMVSRGRLGALTAGVLAADGEPMAALSLVDGMYDTLRGDYWDLQNRVSALAKSSPDSALWRRIAQRTDDVERIQARVQELSGALTYAIGERLPPRDEVLTLDVPAEWQAA